MKQTIKNELLAELGTIDETAFENAYFNSKGIDKEAVKKEIKSVLIQLLEKNANATHKTKGGKIGAILSKVGSIVLRFVNIKFNKK